jgi:formate dehydrogenase iron-sulfur subunit
MSAAPTEIAIHTHEPTGRMGFFTDTTTCIGCKACEVACKQWNDLPADELRLGMGRSYDYTGALSASTWRHVRFVETAKDDHLPAIPAATPNAPLGDDALNLVDAADGGPGLDRWVFMSDVCKHCTNAGCLDACPTGALIRTEFQTVIVQPDVCNGCGYCVPSCPFGVINRDPYDGRAAKCTLCYDRLQDGLEPACAKACPTDSIQFGPYDELVERAQARVVELHERGLQSAYLYGAGDEPGEQLAGNLGAFFLLTEAPERFGLPAKADSPIQENMPRATAAGLTAGVVAAAVTLASFALAHGRAKR